MSNELPESLATAKYVPLDELSGKVMFSDDIVQLIKEIIAETATCIAVLHVHPDSVPHTEGSVSTGALMNQDWEPDMPIDDAFIPLVSENVRMWPIPNTPWFLTDMAGDIVVKNEDDELPHIVDPLFFGTKSEMEQLLAGLRALREQTTPSR